MVVDHPYVPLACHKDDLGPAGVVCDKRGEYSADIHYIHHADREQAEVIGDIYQNPELLSPEGRK
jgi:YopX protein